MVLGLLGIDGLGFGDQEPERLHWLSALLCDAVTDWLLRREEVDLCGSPYDILCKMRQLRFRQEVDLYSRTCNILSQNMTASIFCAMGSFPTNSQPLYNPH